MGEEGLGLKLPTTGLGVPLPPVGVSVLPQWRGGEGVEDWQWKGGVPVAVGAGPLGEGERDGEEEREVGGEGVGVDVPPLPPPPADPVGGEEKEWVREGEAVALGEPVTAPGVVVKVTVGVGS